MTEYVVYDPIQDNVLVFDPEWSVVLVWSIDAKLESTIHNNVYIVLQSGCCVAL